jgi:hypothetical protein
MSEEVRFFLRVALYTLSIAVVYWFISYEIAGSVMLLALGLSAVFFTAAAGTHLRHGREDAPPEGARGIGRALNRLIGFEEHPGQPTDPLAIEDEPIPTSSVWPLVLALGATLLGAGLIFGGWLWVPGALLTAAAAWGWITQFD